MPAPAVPIIQLDGDFTVHAVVGHLEQGDDAEAARDIGPAVAGDVFKSAMRVLSAGVVIVTTWVDGRPWGLTISSCCSLTHEPPQILASLRSNSVSCQEIVRTGRFGVSILGAGQKSLAEIGAAPGVAKFMDEFCEAEGEREEPGAPMIIGSLFHLDCSVANQIAVGDHELIIGHVNRGFANANETDSSPLIYYDRVFWSLGDKLT